MALGNLSYNTNQQAFKNLTMYNNQPHFTSNLLQMQNRLSGSSTLPTSSPQSSSDVTIPDKVKKENNYTIKNIVIAGALTTAALVIADFVLAKGKHFKSLFNFVKKNEDKVLGEGKNSPQNKNLSGKVNNTVNDIDLTNMDSIVPLCEYGTMDAGILKNYFKHYGLNSTNENLVKNLQYLCLKSNDARLSYLEKLFDKQTTTIDNIAAKYQQYKSHEFFKQLPLNAPSIGSENTCSNRIIQSLLGRDSDEVLKVRELHDLVKLNTQPMPGNQHLERSIESIIKRIEKGVTNKENFSSYFDSLYKELTHERGIMDLRLERIVKT